MSEKRKPEIVFFAEILGNGTKKRFKVELFPARLWADAPRSRIVVRSNVGDTYRLRVNGKWWPGDKMLTLSGVMTHLRRAIVAKKQKNKQAARLARYKKRATNADS